MRRKQLLFSKREKAEKATTMGEDNENTEGILGVPNDNTKKTKNTSTQKSQDNNKTKNNESKTQIEQVSNEAFNTETKPKKTKKDLKKELEKLKTQLIEERKESISKVNELNNEDTQKNLELKSLTNKFNEMIQQLKIYEQSLIIRTRNVSKKSNMKSEEEIKKQIKVTEAQIKNYEERAQNIEDNFKLFKKKVEAEKNKESDLNTELTDLKSEITEKNDEIKNLKITSNTHLNCANENRKLLDKYASLNIAYKYELKRAKQLAAIDLGKDEDDQIIKEEYDQKDDIAKAEEDEKNILPKIKVLRFKSENMQKLEMKIIKKNRIGINKSNEIGNAMKYYKTLNNEYNDIDKNIYEKQKGNDNIRKNKPNELMLEDTYLFDENEEKIMEKVLPENMYNSYKSKFNDILQQKKEIQEKLITDSNIMKKEKEAIVNKCEFNKMELKTQKIDYLQLVMKSQKLRDKINNLKQNIKTFNEKINKEQRKLNEENRMNLYYKKLQKNQMLNKK